MNPTYRVHNKAFGFPDEDKVEDEDAADGEIHVLVGLPEYVKKGPRYDRKARKMAFCYGIAGLLFMELALCLDNSFNNHHCYSLPLARIVLDPSRLLASVLARLRSPPNHITRVESRAIPAHTPSSAAHRCARPSEHLTRGLDARRNDPLIAFHLAFLLYPEIKQPYPTAFVQKTLGFVISIKISALFLNFFLPSSATSVTERTSPSPP
ncbi:hypothetical protein PF002_g28687 [Phytophthora fragariae]|uniref:Uncharacterized protein n=1 Tax=Phytophthora fragariae TaxID=53985 RepID=A0A6A3W241_9STRA|nr:hypothetical protein PF002_g28687 [Phytophthora fragariae]